MKNWPTFVFLIVSGLILLGIGGSILLVPHTFFASNGITLSNDANLLSEVRAPGGLLFASAILILIGAFRRDQTTLTIQFVVLVYGSFGLARLLGMGFDGMPSSGIVGATLIELIVAAIGLGILYRWSDSATSEPTGELATAPATR